MRYFVDNNSPGVVYRVVDEVADRAMEHLISDGGNPTEVSYAKAQAFLTGRLARECGPWDMEDAPAFWYGAQEDQC